MNKKVLALMFFLAFFSCALFANNVLAQQKDQPPIDDKMKQTPSPVPDKKPEELKTISPDMVIAKVEVISAELKEVKDREYEASFEIYNDDQYQPQIIPSLVLVKNSGENQAVYQKVTSPDEITLGPKKTKKIKMSFIPADFLDGNFQLYADIRNKAGTQLAVRFLGDINLKKNVDWIELEKDSCKIKTNDKSYNESEMAIAEKDSTISISCTYKNNSTQSKKILPQINVRTGSDFGDQVADEKENEVSFAPNEKKEISFPEFKNTFSKNLAVSATLENENEKPVSRPWESYVYLNEPAFLIANLRSDKDYYQKGETAQLIFTPELGFSGTPNLEIAIEDKDGKSCIDPEKQTKVMELIKGKASFNWKISISRDCIDPKVTAGIKEPAGRVVGESIYVIKTSEESLSGIKKENEVKTKENNKRVLWLIPVIMLFLAFVILRMRDKKKFRDKYVLPVIALAFILGIAGGVNGAEAITAVDKENFLTLTASTDRAYYSYPENQTYRIDFSVARAYQTQIWDPATSKFIQCTNINPNLKIAVETLSAWDPWSRGEDAKEGGEYGWYQPDSWRNPTNWNVAASTAYLANYRTLYGSYTYPIPRIIAYYNIYNTDEYPYLIRMKVGDKIYFTFDKSETSYWDYTNNAWQSGTLVSEGYCGKTVDGLYRATPCEYFGVGGSKQISCYEGSPYPFTYNHRYSMGQYLFQKEDGICIDKNKFVREAPYDYLNYSSFTFDPWCKYGLRDLNGSGGPKVIGSPMDGKFGYTCSGVKSGLYDWAEWSNGWPESVKNANCNVEVTLDGKCGKMNNQPYCSSGFDPANPYAGSGHCNTTTDLKANKDDYLGWSSVFGEPISNFVGAGTTGPFSWKCPGVGGGSSENCQTTPATMAVCGSANGVPYEAAPPLALRCALGKSSNVTDYWEDEWSSWQDGNWHWTCDFYAANGDSLGCAVSCKSPQLPKCLSNAANLRYYDKKPMPDSYWNDYVLCGENGTADSNGNYQIDSWEVTGDETSGPWYWTCYDRDDRAKPTSGPCEGRKIGANLTVNGSSGTVTVPSDQPANFQWSSQNANVGFTAYTGTHGKVTGCVAYTTDPNNPNFDPYSEDNWTGDESSWKTCPYSGINYSSNCSYASTSRTSGYFVKPESSGGLGSNLTSFIPKNLNYFFMCRALGTGFNKTDENGYAWTATSSVTVNVTTPTFPANCGLATSERYCTLNATSQKLCDTTNSTLKDNIVTLANDKFSWTCKSNSGGADATCNAEKYCTTDSVWREIEPN